MADLPLIVAFKDGEFGGESRDFFEKQDEPSSGARADYAKRPGGLVMVFRGGNRRRKHGRVFFTCSFNVLTDKHGVAHLEDAIVTCWIWISIGLYVQREMIKGAYNL